MVKMALRYQPIYCYLCDFFGVVIAALFCFICDLIE